MKIKDGKKVYNENIKTNVNQKTTKMETTDDEGNTNVFYNDFKKVTTVYFFISSNIYDLVKEWVCI